MIHCWGEHSGHRFDATDHAEAQTCFTQLDITCHETFQAATVIPVPLDCPEPCEIRLRDCKATIPMKESASACRR